MTEEGPLEDPASGSLEVPESAPAAAARGSLEVHTSPPAAAARGSLEVHTSPPAAAATQGFSMLHDLWQHKPSPLSQFSAWQWPGLYVASVASGAINKQ